VSEPIGAGFTEMFSDRGGLQAALKEDRPLLLVAVGTRGIAALRSVVEWTPVQAHATTCPVTLFYVADSQATAAYIKDWDTWRESGAVVNVLFTSNFVADAGEGDAATVLRALGTAVLGGEAGLRGAVRSNPKDASVLLAGFQGATAIAFVKRLGGLGVPSDQLLFCEYF
jgi:hypothetical protein